MINAVFVFNPVRHDFITEAILSLYKYTKMDDNRVIVIDQTRKGLFRGCAGWKKIENLIHLYVHSYRNLGFAKSMNEGIIHGLRWGSRYIICSNDDVEFINKKWWNGILETFTMGDNVWAVNPESPRVPLWGYGRDHGHYIDIMNYKKEFSEADYQYLLKGDFHDWKKRGKLYSDLPLPKTFPLQKSGVTDAMAMWLTVFKRECFEEFGLFDERCYPGGLEDYDYNARVYREGGRLLGTTKSWVWHHWGQSKDKQATVDADIDPKLCWSNGDYLWPPEWNEGHKMDPWGKYTNKEGKKVPLRRRKEIAVIKI